MPRQLVDRAPRSVVRLDQARPPTRLLRRLAYLLPSRPSRAWDTVAGTLVISKVMGCMARSLARRPMEVWALGLLRDIRTVLTRPTGVSVAPATMVLSSHDKAAGATTTVPAAAFRERCDLVTHLPLRHNSLTLHRSPFSSLSFVDMRLSNDSQEIFIWFTGN